MTDELKLLAAANFLLNATALGICICRMRVLTPAAFWWVKFEYSFCAMVLSVSALSPLWGWWPELGQIGLSAYVLVSYITSYFSWRRDGIDAPPDIVTDRAKLSTLKGHHE